MTIGWWIKPIIGIGRYIHKNILIIILSYYQYIILVKKYLKNNLLPLYMWDPLLFLTNGDYSSEHHKLFVENNNYFFNKIEFIFHFSIIDLFWIILNHIFDPYIILNIYLG